MLPFSIADLSLPLLQAPMFRVSSAKLAGACAQAGIVGAFQLANPRTVAELDGWLNELVASAARCRQQNKPFAPICVNVNANRTTNAEYLEKIALCERMQVPLVLSSTGDPTEIAERVHAWGGKVIHDVTTLRFAEKAIAAGVDGVMLTCAGAGGHTGFTSTAQFINEVKEFFDGPVIAAGAITTGHDIRRVVDEGADFAYMGTRFIATEECRAQTEYKQMVVDATEDDVVLTPYFTGVPVAEKSETAQQWFLIIAVALILMVVALFNPSN